MQDAACKAYMHSTQSCKVDTISASCASLEAAELHVESVITCFSQPTKSDHMCHKADQTFRKVQLAVLDSPRRWASVIDLIGSVLIGCHVCDEVTRYNDVCTTVSEQTALHRTNVLHRRVETHIYTGHI